MSDKTISVSWPPLALNDAGWLQRLDELATQAEELVGKPVTLQRTAELGLQLVGLIWPALSPETIAASCRASALLKVPVLMSTGPADQCAEVAERLDAIYAAAQADPAAALVEVAPPLLQVVREPDPRIGRKRHKPQPEDHQPEPITQSAPVDHPIEPQPLPEWEPENHPIELAESPDPVAADHPVEPPAPAPAPIEDPDELPAAWRDCATPAPEPPAPPAPAAKVPASGRRRPAPAPAPPGWFSAAEVAELVEVDPCSVGRWRKKGRLGDEGTGWQRCGRGFYFCPDAVENIDRAQIPTGLDQLVAEVQAS